MWTKIPHLMAVLIIVGLVYHLVVSGRPVDVASSVQFVDVTAEAGLAFRHAFAPEQKYIVESMSGGAVFFDYNNDGWLDIYLVNAPTLQMARAGRRARSALYRNNGDGTFTDATDRAGVGQPGWGMGACVGDYNNDGNEDLYVTCLGKNILYRNNGDGTFTDVTERAGVGDRRWSTGAAFADYDNDGDLDLFVANYVDVDLDHLPEFGRGKNCTYRGLKVQCGPRGLPGAGDTLYRNNGDGTFTDVTERAGMTDPRGYYGLGVIWTDYNDDGWMDLYVANDSVPNFLYKNTGRGTFTEIGFPAGVAVNEDGAEQAGMGVTVGDYDRDGHLDLFVTNFSEDYNTLYRSRGDGTFQDVSHHTRTAIVSYPYLGWGTSFFDYDNDGWLDLLVVNGHVYPQVDRAHLDTSYRQRKLLYHNNGDGTFSELAARAGRALIEKRASRGAAFGDIDNDGDLDVLVNNIDGPPTLLRNRGDRRHHAVMIRLIGRTSNRDGIGARVTVKAGSLVQIDEVRSGGSYLSQNDLRLHFGLGESDRVDLIEIRWPSGARQTFAHVKADRLLVIEEGRGMIRATPLASSERR